MKYQSVFQRYEYKYLITREQKEHIVRQAAEYMSHDRYGKSTVRNIYFDTDDYRLIRHSIEKPIYKEKLRIRSYCRVDDTGEVFVELKKKYDDVVYKRRLSMPECDALKWIARSIPSPKQSQIASEIEYFVNFYKPLSPKMFISYEREAFYAKDGSGFRMTFDESILCRRDDLSLESDAYGADILPDGKVLMELKCIGGIPIWMTRLLTELKIYKTPFSKYGIAYTTLIFPKEGF